MIDINQLMQIQNFIDLVDIEPSVEIIEAIIMSDLWPEAVPQKFIIDTDEKLNQRAQTINLLMLGQRIKNCNVLDFGCGNGLCTKEIANVAKQVIGYDIIENERWVSENNYSFTTKLEELESYKPFDYILVYDVFDHILDEETLKKTMKLLYNLIDNGIICVRCHPWTSRHAMHHYFKLNKAFAHYFLPFDTLKKYDIDICRKIVKPVRYYNNLFRENNFIIKKFETINTSLESFFKGPKITNQILKHWRTDQLNQNSNVHSIMEISFVDYELSK